MRIGRNLSDELKWLARTQKDLKRSPKTFLSKDVATPGTYAASFPADDAKSWARQLARFRRLGALIERVKKLESGGK